MGGTETHRGFQQHQARMTLGIQIKESESNKGIFLAISTADNKKNFMKWSAA
jgi:hypothetical protein